MQHSALGDMGAWRETDCTTQVEQGGERTTMATGESRGSTTITTYHDWLRAWRCVQAIRHEATILRVFRLVPGHQWGRVLWCVGLWFVGL